MRSSQQVLSVLNLLKPKLRGYSYVNQHVKYVVTISSVQIAYVDASSLKIFRSFIFLQRATLLPRKSYILTELCLHYQSFENNVGDCKISELISAQLNVILN